MANTIAQENRYAAGLARARAADTARQRGSEERQRLQALSGSSEPIKPEAHRIPPMQAFLLIGVALVADGLSALFTISIFLIPLYWIVWVFAVLGFFVWLHMLGISWKNAKGMRSIILLGAALGIEFMPFLNVLPAWTAFAIGTVINDRLSEFTDILESAAKKRKEQTTDALEELNAKKNRTREENIRLVKARQIMERGSINNNETDPVLRAAYTRARRGEKAYDGTYANRGGFRFDNVRQL